MNRLLERCGDLRVVRGGSLPVPVRPLARVADVRDDRAALSPAIKFLVFGIRPPELRVETCWRLTNGRPRCRWRNEVEPHGRRDVVGAISTAVLGHERCGGAADGYVVREDRKSVV